MKEKTAYKVLKYELNVVGQFTLTVPKVFQPLTIQLQRGVPCLWALVNLGHGTQEVNFRMVGTGQDIGDKDLINHTYLGTVQEQLGFVWHYFMEMTPVEVMAAKAKGDA